MVTCGDKVCFSRPLSIGNWTETNALFTNCSTFIQITFITRTNSEKKCTFSSSSCYQKNSIHHFQTQFQSNHPRRHRNINLSNSIWCKFHRRLGSCPTVISSRLRWGTHLLIIHHAVVASLPLELNGVLRLVNNKLNLVNYKNRPPTRRRRTRTTLQVISREWRSASARDPICCRRCMILSITN